MRAEIAATGVAHYANKSTSVHLLVEAGSNRAGCGRRVASKAESTPFTLENRRGSLAICILVSSAVVLQTPTVGSRLKSALFPTSPATFPCCIRISKGRENSVVTNKKMRANQDLFLFRVGLSRLNFRLGFP